MFTIYIGYLVMLIVSFFEQFMAPEEDKKLFKICALHINAHIDKECKKLNIRKPFVIIGTIPDKNTNGECYYGAFIRIDPLKKYDYLKVLRHELRHCWQWQYHKDIIRWTHANLNRGIDMRQYWYDPVEIDARLYGEHLIESNILDISVNILSAMKEEGSLILQMKIIATLYGDTYAENDLN